MKTRRGVTLIEGMVATMILLIGLVGIFQGMIVASSQNASANKRTRAASIAAELTSAAEMYGRTNTVGLVTLSSVPTGAATPANTNLMSSRHEAAFKSIFDPVAATGVTLKYYFPDSTNPGTLPVNALQSRTPAFTAEDDKVFQRMVATYTANGVTYVMVAVAWNDTGFVKTVTRTTAFYDSTANLTGIEY